MNIAGHLMLSKQITQVRLLPILTSFNEENKFLLFLGGKIKTVTGVIEKNFDSFAITGFVSVA